AAPADSQPAAISKTGQDKGEQDKGKEDKGEQDKGAAGDKSGKPEARYKFTLQEQSEVWANLAGGGRRGSSYNGQTTASLNIDLEKALGWKKARFFVSAFDIHGHGPTRALVGNNQLISNLEATPS